MFLQKFKGHLLALGALVVTIYFVPVSFSQVRLDILYLYLHDGGGGWVCEENLLKKSPIQANSYKEHINLLF